MKLIQLFFLLICIPLGLCARVYLFNDNPDQMVSISAVGNVSFGSSSTQNPVCQPVGVFMPVTGTSGHYTQVGNSFELQVPQAEPGQTPGYAQTAKVYSTESTSRYFIVCDGDPPRPLKVSEVIGGSLSKITEGRCTQQGLPSLDTEDNPCASENGGGFSPIG